MLLGCWCGYRPRHPPTPGRGTCRQVGSMLIGQLTELLNIPPLSLPCIGRYVVLIFFGEVPAPWRWNFDTIPQMSCSCVMASGSCLDGEGRPESETARHPGQNRRMLRVRKAEKLIRSSYFDWREPRPCCRSIRHWIRCPLSA